MKIKKSISKYTTLEGEKKIYEYHYTVCGRKGCNKPQHKTQYYCEQHAKEYYDAYRRGKNILAIEKDPDIGDIKRGKWDYWVIYYIPSIHYCGITHKPYERMYGHKKKGTDVKGWKILDTAKTKIDALYIEMSYHLKGMNGHIELSRELAK